MCLRHGLTVLMVPPLLPPNALTAALMSSYWSPYTPSGPMDRDLQHDAEVLESSP